MIETLHVDTKARLLHAAADLIAAAPGEDFSLREVCDRAGVKMPTLYHFFGNKQGLVEAVVEYGFDRYLAAKQSHESSGDPVQDIRDGWDAHVAFGIENPGFYALMYGQVRPGDSRAATAEPAALLRALVKQVDAQGRLAVDVEQAVGHILATNVGVTLRQISLGVVDPALSATVRDGVVAAITGEGAGSASDRSTLLHALDLAVRNPQVLGKSETLLLAEWLRRLADAMTR